MLGLYHVRDVIFHCWALVGLDFGPDCWAFVDLDFGLDGLRYLYMFNDLFNSDVGTGTLELAIHSWVKTLVKKFRC